MLAEGYFDHEASAVSGQQAEADEVGIGDLDRSPRDHPQWVLTGGSEQVGADFCRGLEPSLLYARFLVEPGVADRGSCRQGEREHELFVFRAEPTVGAVGQVEVAVYLAARLDGHAEEGLHRWVFCREAGRAIVVGHVLEANWSRIGDDRAEQSVAFGQVADAGCGVVVDTDVDELFEAAVVAYDAQRAVLRSSEFAGGFDDVAQYLFEGKVAVHCLDGTQQPA